LIWLRSERCGNCTPKPFICIYMCEIGIRAVLYVRIPALPEMSLFSRPYRGYCSFVQLRQWYLAHARHPREALEGNKAMTKFSEKLLLQAGLGL